MIDLTSLGWRVKKNEPMAEHTTLGVGGPADLFVELDTEDQLSHLMMLIGANEQRCRHAIPWMILGDGANLLVSDKGIRGIVIKLVGDFERIDVDRTTITAGSAAAISRVADTAAKHDLSGLEGVGTVPGSVGGAIVMNAGTNDGYIDAVIRSVSVVSNVGEKRTLSREECGFTYRNSRFQMDKSFLITSAVLSLQPGDGKAIADHLARVRKYRSETQPQGRSAGCFFKNPANSHAGYLIEISGGKGMREGGAEVSTIHGNFIMNVDNATASDLYVLAERVREMVRKEHNIELEYEVRLVGEW